MILVFGGLQLYGISSADGEILWRTNTANASQGGMFSLRKVLTGEDKNSLYGVGFTQTSGFCVWKVYLFTGRLVMQEAATVKANICTDELVVTKHTVIALDCEGKTIFTGHIGPVKSFSIHRTIIRDIVPDAFGKARLLKSTLEGVFLLRFIDQIVFIRIGRSDHDLEVLEIFERPAVISNSLELTGNKTAVMLVQHVGLFEDRQVAIRVVTREGEKDETLSDILELDYERGLVQQVHISGYIRKDRSCGFRALLVMEDQSIVFLQNSKILWTREDGLATVADVVAVELPTKEIEVTKSTVAHKFRVKGHIQRLMALLKRRGSEGNGLRHNIKDRSKLVQDDHGFRKLLIVLTKGGKLLALHTGNGKILWSLLIPSFKKSLKRSKAVVLKLLPWSHPTQNQNPVVLVIGNSGSKGDASGILAWVDSYTGTELHSATLSHAIEDVRLPAWKVFQNEKVYMLLDGKKNMHIFPMSVHRSKILQNQASVFLPPEVFTEKSAISGYGIDWSAQMPTDTGMASSCVFKSKKSWKVDFSQRSEKLLATSEQRDDQQVVHASTNVMLDENDSCRVSNRTLMLVATAPVSLSKASKKNSSEGTSLAFYIMDVGTGEILEEFRRSETQGPVRMVKEGNWFVYCYFNLQAHKYECSVLEILATDCEEYQSGSIEMNASALNQPHNGIRMLKSERAMYSPSTIKALSIVKSPNGNLKQVLMATLDGQVILSDMSSVNDRNRGSKMNIVVQWIRPFVDPASQLYLTRADPVEGLRKIVSLPSKFRSASIVFVYGIDIFLAHTMLLHSTPTYFKGYSFYVVLATIAAMLIAISVATILSRRKRVKKLGRHDNVSQQGKGS